MPDLWPYSQRNSGAVTDLEHEALWLPIADGILPGQPSTALAVSIGGGQWTVQPGRIHIAGHVLVIDEAASGPLPAGAAAERISVVCAFVDRTQSPWTYGVQLVQGSPGNGRPTISQSPTGVYRVPLRAISTSTAGAQTLLPDERVFLSRVGGDVAVGGWKTLPLASGMTTFDQTPQYRLTHNGKRVELRGSIQRSNSQPFASTTTVASIPTEARPTAGTQRYTGQAALGGGRIVGATRMEALVSGVLRVVTVDQPTWISINGYFWRD
jgi:hypothetical protein